MRTRADFVTQRCVVWIDAHILCSESEDSAVGHGIARIDAQVEQHLMQLGGIADQRPCTRGNIDP